MAYGLEDIEKSFMPLLRSLFSAFEGNDEVFKEHLIDAVTLVSNMRRNITTSVDKTKEADKGLKYALDRYYIFLARSAYSMRQPAVAKKMLGYVDENTVEVPVLASQMGEWISLRTDMALLYFRLGDSEQVKNTFETFLKLAESKRFKDTTGLAIASAALLKQRLDAAGDAPRRTESKKLSKTRDSI